jgi:hypothetical protein
MECSCGILLSGVRGCPLAPVTLQGRTMTSWLELIYKRQERIEQLLEKLLVANYTGIDELERFVKDNKRVRREENRETTGREER